MGGSDFEQKNNSVWESFFFQVLSQVGVKGSPMKEDEPMNGLTNQECAHILEQELDGIDSLPSSPSRESEQENLPAIKTEDEESVTCGRLPLTLHPSTPTPSDPSEWCLLDLTYGVPLFDAQINGLICRNIIEKLSQKDSLEKLTIYNENLASRLKDFIETIQAWGEESSGVDLPFHSKHDNSWPLLNIVFLNGQLSPWNGK